MNALHLDLSRGFRGGQRQLLLLAREQVRRGQRPTVAAASLHLADQLEEAGVTTMRIPANPVRALPALRRLAHHHHVLHAHESRAHGLARALAPGRALVVHRRIDDPPRPRATTRWKYRAGDFVCVSQAVDDVLRAFGVPPHRRHVVHSAVPEAPAAPRPPPRGPLRLVALGALVSHKGHADLIAAVQQIPEATLDIVGDGPLRGALGGERVRLLGDPAGRLPDWSRYDLLVHPSRTEGLGTAVLDAQAAGVPVLATRAGGLPEAVAPDGWLVHPGSPSALAEALRAIAACRHELPDRGRRARDWVRARFSVSHMADGVDAVYARVSSSR